MNDALKTQISAFVDGELSDNESELLVRRLSQDAALRQQVSQYLEIGRLIRQEQLVPGVDQLHGRITAALGAEPVVVPDKSREVVGSRLMTPATGVAVAATVAAMALVGLSQLDSPAETDFGTAVAIDSDIPGRTEPESDFADRPSERLLQYYQRHGNSSAELGANGILTRMVTFDLSEGELVEIEPDPHLLPADAIDTESLEDSVDVQR